MFVDFFIRRPVFATVCALLIILGGAISIPTLPIAQFPSLAPPQVVVSSGYIGANAQTVESAVTIPLEQAINGVPGMKYMTSASGNDGSSVITVTFDISRDVDLASVDVQNRVNQALGRLPNEVKNTGIFVNKQASGFVFGAGVYTENGQYDSLFLSNYMDVYVRDAIKRVPGVADALIFGERKYAMRLWLDPSKMAQRGLTATNILSALQEQNVQVAAGQIGQPPTPSGQTFQISVRAIGRLTEPSEFENIVLKTGTDGTLVRVKDVGRAELGAEDYSSRLRFNGHEAVGMGVTQLPGANALDVDKAAKAEFLKLSKSFQKLRLGRFVHVQSIRSRQLRHAHAHRFMSIKSQARAVIFGPQFRAAHIFDPHQRSVRARLQNDVLEFRRLRKPADRAHADLKSLPAWRGRLADLPRGYLHVLLLQRRKNVRSRQSAL